MLQSHDTGTPNRPDPRPVHSATSHRTTCLRGAKVAVTAIPTQPSPEYRRGSRPGEAAQGDRGAGADLRTPERSGSVQPTCWAAESLPPPPELQQLLGAVHGNQEAMDDFVSAVSGAVSPTDFFAEENVGAIFAAAHVR